MAEELFPKEAKEVAERGIEMIREGVVSKRILLNEGEEFPLKEIRASIKNYMKSDELKEAMERTSLDDDQGS